MLKISISLIIGLLLIASPLFGADAVFTRYGQNEVVGWSVYAYDDDVNTSAEMITELNTAYAQLAAEDNIEVLSDVANDTSTGITIYGIDNKGNQVSEFVALNGTASTTAETSTTTFRYVDRAELNNSCYGNVTVRRATGDTFITSIPQYYLSTQMVQHFNGDKTSYITEWSAGVKKTTDYVTVDLRWYPDDADSLGPTFGYTTLDRKIFKDNVTEDYVRTFAQPIKCPAGGWIAVYGTADDAATIVYSTVQGYDVRP